MPSLFTQATKRARVDRRDEKEDRLTEIFAATLERAPDAARTLVDSWAPHLDTGGLLRVDTQVREERTERVDLELRFVRPAGLSTTVVWIEIKRGAPESGDQVARYMEALERRKCRERGLGGEVVYLTPNGDPCVSTRSLPDGPVLASWLRVGSTLLDWARRQSDGFASRLIEEFVDYLEEDGVTASGLSLADVIVLDRHEQTAATARDLIFEVERKLDGRGLELDLDAAARRPKAGANWSAWFPSRPNLGTGWPVDLLLEWRFAWHEEPGRWCFASGLTWTGSPERSPWQLEETLQDVAKRDDWFTTVDDNSPRLFRWLYPEELVRFEHFEAQAEHVAAWIDESFRQILDAVPYGDGTAERD